MQPHHHLTGGAVLAKDTPSAFMLHPSNKLYLVDASEAHVPGLLQVPYRGRPRKDRQQFAAGSVAEACTKAEVSVFRNENETTSFPIRS